MSVIRPTCALLSVVLALGAFDSAVAKGKDSFASLTIESGFPEVTAEDRALAGVPFAPGAPAVVLLDAEMQTQQPDFAASQVVHIERFRRVKILTQAGVEHYADYLTRLEGDWRVNKVAARTVLPDGTVVDAKDSIFRESSANDKNGETAVRTIRVAFPRVQVGAILDYRASLVRDGAIERRWLVQSTIPTVESRFLMVFPDGLQIKIGSFFLSAAEQKPISGRTAMGRFYGWRFVNEPSIPDEPNQPPLGDLSKALVVFPESFKTEGVQWEISPDWKTWGKARSDGWSAFLKQKDTQAESAARQACAGKTTALEKAEAVRQALRARFRVDATSVYPPYQKGADDLLAKGSGDSGEAAALALSMLAACGVDAVPVAYRPRDEGMLPKDTPLANLLEDVLIRFPGEGGPAYMTFVEDIPAGVLPPDARGVWAMPMDGKAAAPELLPDATAGDDRAIRAVTATLGADGSLSGELTATYHGVWATRWREALRARSDDARTTWLTDRFRRFAAGLTLQDVEIRGLADDGADLVVKAKLNVAGYATTAGRRLLVNANLLGRELSGDWSATERKTPVDLGEAYETIDTIMLTLPPEAADAAVPTPPADYNAGNVGRYTASYERRGNAVILTRTMRLDLYRFKTDGYAGLRHWFGDIAAMDDRPVIVSLK
jgi:hypothetical protein